MALHISKNREDRNLFALGNIPNLFALINSSIQTPGAFIDFRESGGRCETDRWTYPCRQGSTEAEQKPTRERNLVKVQDSRKRRRSTRKHSSENKNETRSRSGSDQYDDLSENTANDNASKGSRLVRSCPCSEFQMNYLEETKNFTPFRSVRQPSAYTVRFVPSACNLSREALVMKWGRSHVLIITSIRFKIWDRIIR